MTTVALSSRSSAARPWTLTAAVVLSAINGIASVATLPLIWDDIPGVGIILSIAFGVAALLLAWGMWNFLKWAAIGTFVITALNGLLSIPGIFAGPSTGVKVLCVVGVPLMTATCVLIVMKSTRQALK